MLKPEALQEIVNKHLPDGFYLIREPDSYGPMTQFSLRTKNSDGTLSADIWYHWISVLTPESILSAVKRDIDGYKIGEDIKKTYKILNECLINVELLQKLNLIL